MFDKIKKALTKYRDTAFTLKSVYESAPDMIFTRNASGNYTSVNRNYAEYTGLSRAELVGKTPYELDVLPDEVINGLKESDRQVFEEGKIIKERVWLTYNDGTKKFCETVKAPIINKGKVTGLLGMVRDVTEIKQALDEGERQNMILETVSRVSEFMLEPDTNGFEHAIMSAMDVIGNAINADIIDLWGIQGTEVKSHYHLMYDWNADTVASNIAVSDYIIGKGESAAEWEKSLSRGEALNCPVRVIPSASRKMFKTRGIESILVVPIVLRDTFWGFIGAYDLDSNRRFTESEELLLRSSRRMIASAIIRNEITEDLRRQSSELESALRVKRDFLARMSHEIRTPMNAIIGMTELALREKMSNAATEHIITVKQAGANILTIINDILDFSKIESGLMEVVRSDFQLSAMLCDVISIIRMRMVYTHVRFLVNIDSNLPNTLVGDETKLKQILINLLGNAVKYTEKGFVNLAVSGKVQENDMLDLKLIVADSGIGIRPEDQDKMFQDYIQVDVERNIGIEGVGLGLSITHGLTKAMGGKIVLESEYGIGSVFTVTIPLKIEDYGKLAEVREPERMKTLVYERRTQTADSLVGTIKNLGIPCDLAGNAEEFARLLATETHTYVMGSTELLAGINIAGERLSGNFRVIGITEASEGNEAEDVVSGNWKTLTMPVHAISLASAYNDEDDSSAHSDEDEMSISFSAPDARVLVVDDINTNLKVAKGLLSPYEMIVDLCESGSAAIEAVKNVKYDMVFMDHRMPGIDGMEATQIIREMGIEDTHYSELPIVALTANAVTNMRDMFLSVGFSDFIPKPIDTVLLNSVLRKWIPKHKQRRYFAVEEHTIDPFGLENELKIDGVDVEKGVRLTGGMTDVYLEVLSTFMEEGNEKIAIIRESLDSGNLPLYTTTIHALKGALANIGAIELSDTAASLENAGDRKNIAYIESVNERFIIALKRLFANIRAVLSDSSRSISVDESSEFEDRTVFIEALKQLQEGLSGLDAGVMNRALETLMKQAHRENDIVEVRKLSKHVLMAEYDEAEELIKTMLE